mmetsp:Transcript_63046/g.186229  ORF Transcript_63046/g.186229 Transcript_63046/m.186229 type:complete len:290 (+) Transcript_63046:76-945(+)
MYPGLYVGIELIQRVTYLGKVHPDYAQPRSSRIALSKSQGISCAEPTATARPSPKHDRQHLLLRSDGAAALRPGRGSSRRPPDRAVPDGGLGGGPVEVPDMRPDLLLPPSPRASLGEAVLVSGPTGDGPFPSIRGRRGRRRVRRSGRRSLGRCGGRGRRERTLEIGGVGHVSRPWHGWWRGVRRKREGRSALSGPGSVPDGDLGEHCRRTVVGRVGEARNVDSPARGWRGKNEDHRAVRHGWGQVREGEVDFGRADPQSGRDEGGGEIGIVWAGFDNLCCCGIYGIGGH